MVFLTLRAHSSKPPPVCQVANLKQHGSPPLLYSLSPFLQLACLEAFLLKSNKIVLEFLFESFLFLLTRLKSLHVNPLLPSNTGPTGSHCQGTEQMEPRTSEEVLHNHCQHEDHWLKRMTQLQKSWALSTLLTSVHLQLAIS